MIKYMIKYKKLGGGEKDEENTFNKWNANFGFNDFSILCKTDDAEQLYDGNVKYAYDGWTA